MKNKKLKNLLWVIALLPILVIFMKIILPSIKKEREVKAYQDQNNECYIEIKNIVDIETHGEEVDVYPVNRNGQLWKTPFKYNGKGDFSLTASNGDEVYPGTWKFVSKHPGVSIKAYQQVN